MSNPDTHVGAIAEVKDGQSIKATPGEGEELESLPQLEKGVPVSPIAQVLGIAVLEFGVLLHRYVPHDVDSSSPTFSEWDNRRIVCSSDSRSP